MSPLLQLKEGEEYPWSCNLYDLENLVDMLLYIGKNADDFIDYINWRVENHAKIIASDELEILEVYFINKDIRRIEGYIYIPTLEYSLIDKIYFEKNGIEYYHSNFKSRKLFKKKITGRNELCPCGSGKKYKKCCLN